MHCLLQELIFAVCCLVQYSRHLKLMNRRCICCLERAPAECPCAPTSPRPCTGAAAGAPPAPPGAPDGGPGAPPRHPGQAGGHSADLPPAAVPGGTPHGGQDRARTRYRRSLVGQMLPLTFHHINHNAYCILFLARKMLS